MPFHHVRVVSKAGVEPARPRGHNALDVACLPSFTTSTRKKYFLFANGQYFFRRK